ncbi:MAG: hypothetical protein GF311_26500 [Candidatus Lokiarchaeota archaeon]|nr:hypothetical protein [Candidatus Lokiarchaeota archaeon]
MSSDNSILDIDKLSILEEGRAKFLLYDKDIGSIPTKSMDVFYNNRMEINRDLTCLAVEVYKNHFNEENLIIIDSMAGSGIGAIRLLKECGPIKTIFINDINPTAKKLINKNIKLNDLDNEKTDIRVSRKDANFLFGEIVQEYLTNNLSISKKPNIISIDPFGTPNLYIDGAMKTIQKKNGLLCITATDTAVLFGVKPSACRRKYMAKPLHNEFCKEIGMRILLYFIARIANINNLGIIPLLTFYHSHFIRAFIATFPEKKPIAKQIETYKFLIYCKNCGNSFTSNNNNIQEKTVCEICGEDSNLDYAGPLWSERIHDADFLSKVYDLNTSWNLGNKNKLDRILTYCREELRMPISYYNIHELCKDIKTRSIPKMELLLDKIQKNGYRASRTHFDFTSIKTDMDIISLKQLLSKIDREEKSNDIG